MEGYKRREIEELFVLERRLAKLTKALENPNPAIKESQLKLMQRQKTEMEAYVKTLQDRLADDLTDDNTAPYEFSFGVAIELLKEGCAMKRKGWNGKNMFIVKQIPCTINEDIIPGMQSLPDSAKAELLNTTKKIEYTNQNLIINTETGRADSWVPSSSDMYAEDWMFANNPAWVKNFMLQFKK